MRQLGVTWYRSLGGCSNARQELPRVSRKKRSAAASSGCSQERIRLACQRFSKDRFIADRLSNFCIASCANEPISEVKGAVLSWQTPLRALPRRWVRNQLPLASEAKHFFLAGPYWYFLLVFPLVFGWPLLAYLFFLLVFHSRCGCTLRYGGKIEIDLGVGS